MAGRFPFWHRRAGAVDVPAGLRDLGKKLLEQLAERQRLGAPPTLVLRGATREGSVEARMVYGRPQVFFRLTPPGEAPLTPEYLDGFIVRPSAAGDQRLNASNNHVIVDGRLMPWFYDDSYLPPDFDERHGRYGELFPSGVGEFGNVDWRNKDQSVAVTFFGPETRYFNAGFGDELTWSRFVFFKGSGLLDLADDPEHASFWTIRGACLRKDDEHGLSLFVVVRTFSGGLHERLLRYPVRTKLPKYASKWKLAPTLEVIPNEDDDLEAVVLGEWFMPDTNSGTGHPWHFNQSGTEARCILGDNDGVAYQEWVLRVEEGEAQIERVIDLPQVTTAQAITRSGIYRPIDITTTGTWGIVTNWDGATLSYREGVQSSPAVNLHGYAGPTRAYVTSDETTSSVTPAADWVDVAVDFRDDVPVYAQARMESEQYHRTVAANVDGTYVATITVNGATFRFDPAWPGIGATWLMTPDVIWQSISDASHGYEASITHNEVIGGIKTDWMELVSTRQRVRTYTEQAQSDSTLTYVPDGDETPVGNNTVQFDGRTIYTGIFSDLLGTATGSASFTSADSNVTTTATFLLAHLDLRYRDASYVHRIEVEEFTENGAGSLALNTSALVQDGGVSDPIVPSAPAFGTKDTLTETSNDGTLKVTFQTFEAFSETFELAADVTTPASGAFKGTFCSPRGIFPSTTGIKFTGDAMIGACLVCRDAEFPQGLGTLQHPVDSLVLDSEPVTETSSSSETQPDEPKVNVLREVSAWFANAKADHWNMAEKNIGSWLSYRRGYCFSCFVPILTAPSTYTLEYRHGVGKVGRAPTTLDAVTGWTTGDGVVRFHPVSFIPPTA